MAWLLYFTDIGIIFCFSGFLETKVGMLANSFT